MFMQLINALWGSLPAPSPARVCNSSGMKARSRRDDFGIRVLRYALYFLVFIVGLLAFAAGEMMILQSVFLKSSKMVTPSGYLFDVNDAHAKAWSPSLRYTGNILFFTGLLSTISLTLLFVQRVLIPAALFICSMPYVLLRTFVNGVIAGMFHAGIWMECFLKAAWENDNDPLIFAIAHVFQAPVVVLKKAIIQMQTEVPSSCAQNLQTVISGFVLDAIAESYLVPSLPYKLFVTLAPRCYRLLVAACAYRASTRPWSLNEEKIKVGDIEQAFRALCLDEKECVGNGLKKRLESEGDVVMGNAVGGVEHAVDFDVSMQSVDTTLELMDVDAATDCDTSDSEDEDRMDCDAPEREPSPFPEDGYLTDEEISKEVKTMMLVSDALKYRYTKRRTSASPTRFSERLINLRRQQEMERKKEEERQKENAMVESPRREKKTSAKSGRKSPVSRGRK